MSKELDDLKEEYTGLVELGLSFRIDPGHYGWLVSQVEKKEELIKRIDKIYNQINGDALADGWWIRGLLSEICDGLDEDGD